MMDLEEVKGSGRKIPLGRGRGAAGMGTGTCWPCVCVPASLCLVVSQSIEIRSVYVSRGGPLGSGVERIYTSVQTPETRREPRKEDDPFCSWSRPESGASKEEGAAVWGEQLTCLYVLQMQLVSTSEYCSVDGGG